MTVRVNKSSFNIREKLSELERPIGLKGSELMKVNTAQEAGSLIGVGRKNILINGDMRIAQRGTSDSVNGTSQRYVLDRYLLVSDTAGNWEYTQSTNAPSGFTHSARIENTSAFTPLSSNSYCLLRTSLEGNDVRCLGYGTTNSKELTVSFWCRSNVTGTYTAEIQIENSKEVSRRYTIDSANTWEYKTVTFPKNVSYGITTTNEFGAAIIFWLAAGSANNSGTSLHTSWGDGTSDRAAGNVNLADTVGNYFEITGIQAEIGNVATEFERRSFSEEMQLCMRYYEKSFEYGFTPAHGSDTTSFATFSGIQEGPAHHRAYMPGNTYSGRSTFTIFRVPKRTTPSIGLYGNSNGDPWGYGVGWITGAWGASPNEMGFEMINEAQASSTLHVQSHWVASAEF